MLSWRSPIFWGILVLWHCWRASTTESGRLARVYPVASLSHIRRSPTPIPLKLIHSAFAAKFMATASGTSVLGYQTLLFGVTLTAKQMSITFPGRAVPPVARLGYFYVYQYLNASPFPHYIVEDGLIRSPGLLLPIRLSNLGSTYLHKLDVVWSVPGIAWTAALV